VEWVLLGQESACKQESRVWVGLLPKQFYRNEVKRGAGGCPRVDFTCKPHPPQKGRVLGWAWIFLEIVPDFVLGFRGRGGGENFGIPTGQDVNRRILGDSGDALC